MDVEKTIEFILQAQANSEAHLGKIDQRLDGITTLLQQGMKLVLTFQTEAGQKINAVIDAQLRLEESQKRTDAKVAELAESQKRTDAKVAELAESQKLTGAKVAELAEGQKALQANLNALIDSLRQGRNGH